MKVNYPGRRYLLIFSFSVTGIFLLDIFTPRGYDPSFFYFFSLLFALFPSAPSSYHLLFPVIVLIFISGFFKPPLLPSGFFFLNKISVAVVLVSVAVLLEQWKERGYKFRQVESILRAPRDAPVGLMLLVNRRIKWLNAPMGRILGYTPEEVIGKTTRGFMSEEDYGRITKGYAEIKSRGWTIREVGIYGKEGVRNILGMLVAIDRTDLGKGVVATAVDVTDRWRAEAEVFRQKQTFQALAENSPDVIFLYDVNKRFRYANATIQAYAGHSPDFFVGKTIGELDMPAKVKKFWERMFDEVMADRKIVVREMDFPAVGGDRIFVNTYLPVFSATGQVDCVIGFAHDITEFKTIQKMLEKRADEAEEGRMILETLMENVPQGIAIADAPDVGIKMVSRYGRALGVNKEQLVGIGFEKQLQRWWFFHPDGTPVAEEDVALTAAVRKGKLTIGQELRMKTVAGQMIPVLVNASPIRDSRGRITAGVMVWSDISKLKQAEAVLRRDKDTFERLVMERTKELISAQLQLEQAKRLSDIGSLAATVAHELRNPLWGIRVAAYNIKRRAREAPIGSQLLNIDKKIAQSDQIINNLLFYARLRKPQLEPVRIYHVLLESIESFRRRFADFTVIEDLEPVKELEMSVDPMQMSEMFNNIINNAYDAVKEKKGRLRISGRREGSLARFVFEDDGIGIAPDELKKIFEPFYTTKAKGTGLGLTVTKQIVVLHGGAINVRSELGKGTVITVTIPVV